VVGLSYQHHKGAGKGSRFRKATDSARNDQETLGGRVEEGHGRAQEFPAAWRGEEGFCSSCRTSWVGVTPRRPPTPNPSPDPRAALSHRLWKTKSPKKKECR
jgi:hypothetical protein